MTTPSPRAALTRLLRGMTTAVLTTIAADETLHARPMLLVDLDADGRLWFFTSLTTKKAADVRRDARVNVTFVSRRHTRFVSVTGTGSIRRDRDRIDRLWKPTYRAWFPGGRDDADLALLAVDAVRVRYWRVPSSRLVRALGAARALLTGRKYEAGERGEIMLKTATTEDTEADVEH